MTDKWEISGWGAAQGQIRAAIDFLCKDKIGAERAEVIDDVIGLVRAIGRGEQPEPESTLLQREEYERESWARRTAQHIVEGAMSGCESLPQAEPTALIYEIAR
jgi:hypothetical protein